MKLAACLFLLGCIVVWPPVLFFLAFALLVAGLGKRLKKVQPPPFVAAPGGTRLEERFTLIAGGRP